MELVREFRQLSQVILLDYGADCAKLQRRREQGKQIRRHERSVADDPYSSTNKHSGVRNVCCSYCRGAVSIHKSGSQEEFVKLAPHTSSKRGERAINVL